MTALAARLDPCVNWFKLLVRTRGRVLWLFPAALAAVYLWSLAGGNPIGGFFERRAELRANAPLLAEARALNLDYEQVLAKPASYAGKPVLWCVTTYAPDTSYVLGRPGWRVALNGSFDEYKTSGNSGGHCLDVLAVITGFERGLIQLRPVEKL
jgi:hypothetical protein